MLRSLEIQNFKGIKQGKLEDLAQVNVLVGRNNSGKSTILDALVLLRRPFVRIDYLKNEAIDQIINRRVRRDRINYDELWFKMDTNAPLTLSAEFITGGQFTEEWVHGPSVSIRFRTTQWAPDLGDSYEAKNYAASPWWRRLSAEIQQESAAFVALVHILDPQGIHYPSAEGLWSELIKDRRDTRVVQMLNEIYGTNIEYLSFMPFPQATRLVAALPHTGVAVDWLGDGMRYAVNILALGVLLKGTALLVEELETHQHPESLRKLTQTLFELAKQQDLQLFLTTHSMELITYCLDVAEEKGIDLNLHHLNLDKEGTLRVTSMSQPSAQLLLDIGHDPRLHYKYIGVE